MHAKTSSNCIDVVNSTKQATRLRPQFTKTHLTLRLDTVADSGRSTDNSGTVKDLMVSLTAWQGERNVFSTRCRHIGKDYNHDISNKKSVSIAP